MISHVAAIVLVVLATLIGLFFGRMEASACRQRAAFAEAEADRQRRRADDLEHRLVFDAAPTAPDTSEER